MHDMCDFLNAREDALLQILFGPLGGTPHRETPKEKRRELCSPDHITPIGSGEHKHKCPRCGETWKHPDAMQGDTREAFEEGHTCPTCLLPEVCEKHFTRGDIPHGHPDAWRMR